MRDWTLINLTFHLVDNSGQRLISTCAEAQKWQKCDWAANLSALLTGKALEVCYCLPMDKAKHHKALKDALPEWFPLTKEVFWNKFLVSMQMNKSQHRNTKLAQKIALEDGCNLLELKDHLMTHGTHGSWAFHIIMSSRLDDIPEGKEVEETWWRCDCNKQLQRCSWRKSKHYW